MGNNKEQYRNKVKRYFLRVLARDSLALCAEENGDRPMYEGGDSLQRVDGLRELRLYGREQCRRFVAREFDLSAGLAIARHETVGFGAVEAGLGVAVVVHVVFGGLDPEGWRRRDGNTALEQERRAAVGHVGLVLPIAMVEFDDAGR